MKFKPSRETLLESQFPESSFQKLRLNMNNKYETSNKDAIESIKTLVKVANDVISSKELQQVQLATKLESMPGLHKRRIFMGLKLLLITRYDVLKALPIPEAVHSDEQRA